MGWERLLQNSERNLELFLCRRYGYGNQCLESGGEPWGREREPFAYSRLNRLSDPRPPVWQYVDTTRGPLNEGGLYGERMGKCVGLMWIVFLLTELR